MTSLYNEEENAVFDRILGERRTNRRFKPDIPQTDMIMKILHAGLHAPFAGVAVDSMSEYFRRFFVIKNNSPVMAGIIPLVLNKVSESSALLEDAMKKNEHLRTQATGFAGRLAMFKKTGIVPGIGTAPYFVIAAEKKGFPPVEPQTLGHCMENMWLKATALRLGFQLVSITSQLADNEEFCRIIGIKPGEWELMGCAIGYPAEELSPSIRPDVNTVTTWL